MMPNNVNDVKLRVTPLQLIDVVIDLINVMVCVTMLPMIKKRLVGGNAGASEPCRFRSVLESRASRTCVIKC